MFLNLETLFLVSNWNCSRDAEIATSFEHCSLKKNEKKSLVFYSVAYKKQRNFTHNSKLNDRKIQGVRKETQKYRK